MIKSDKLLKKFLGRVSGFQKFENGAIIFTVEKRNFFGSLIKEHYYIKNGDFVLQSKCKVVEE